MISTKFQFINLLGPILNDAKHENLYTPIRYMYYINILEILINSVFMAQLYLNLSHMIAWLVLSFPFNSRFDTPKFKSFVLMTCEQSTYQLVSSTPQPIPSFANNLRCSEINAMKYE